MLNHARPPRSRLGRAVHRFLHQDMRWYHVIALVAALMLLGWGLSALEHALQQI
jgi:hypothetical protein